MINAPERGEFLAEDDVVKWSTNDIFDAWITLSPDPETLNTVALLVTILEKTREGNIL